MVKNKTSYNGADLSPRIPQRDKINFSFDIKEVNWTENQKKFISLVDDKKTRICFLSAPAGAAKTFLSVYCGLKMLSQKRASEIVYVRTIVESASKSLGSLPGESELKFKPFTIPLEDKLSELLSKDVIAKLEREKRIRPIPYNYLRGANFNTTFIIGDEAQNASFAEITTLISRVGKFSKLIITGDPMQSDLNGKSGFKKMMSLFNDDESKSNGIYCIEFTKDDIMRDGIIKFLLERIEKSEFYLNKH
jgi:phosphate starvation-inducible PhoH-like protein